MSPFVSILIHFAAFAVSLYALSALNFTKLIHPAKTMQAQTLMILAAMALATLVVQFLFGLRLS